MGMGAVMRANPLQQLYTLRNRLAKAHSSRKAGSAIHRKMVEITTRQLRREIREDRRKVS
jgi:hypothetical protein